MEFQLLDPKMGLEGKKIALPMCQDSHATKGSSNFPSTWDIPFPNQWDLGNSDERVYQVPSVCSAQG